MNNGANSAERYSNTEYVAEPLEFIVDCSPISRIDLTEDFGGVKIECDNGEVLEYHLGPEIRKRIGCILVPK